MNWVIVFISWTGQPIIVDYAETREQCEELAVDYGAKCAIATKVKK
jgi:hypothetical protein